MSSEPVSSTTRRQLGPIKVDDYAVMMIDHAKSDLSSAIQRILYSEEFKSPVKPMRSFDLTEMSSSVPSIVQGTIFNARFTSL